MSYYNLVNLQYQDDIALDFECIKEPLMAHLDENGIHQDPKIGASIGPKTQRL